MGRSFVSATRDHRKMNLAGLYFVALASVLHSQALLTDTPPESLPLSQSNNLSKNISFNLPDNSRELVLLEQDNNSVENASLSQPNNSALYVSPSQSDSSVECLSFNQSKDSLKCVLYDHSNSSKENETILLNRLSGVEEESNSTDTNHTQGTSEGSLNCKTIAYSTDDVWVIADGNLLLHNFTFSPGRYRITHEGVHVCAVSIPRILNLKLHCATKEEYTAEDFQILPNHSALVLGYVVDHGWYEFDGEHLYLCAYIDRTDELITIVCSTISIFSLLLVLLGFCYLPGLRKTADYNLASLSVAFILAYCSLLIGQIHSVVGPACVVSGVFQHIFFLAAFFCMNVMALDIWLSMRSATENLSNHRSSRQFLWYSLYAWGCPAAITLTTLSLDHIEGVPEDRKPHFGANKICWITGNWARNVFFVVPAFLLIALNILFFAWSVAIIRRNGIKRQMTIADLLMYVKMASMMGLAWLIAVFAFTLNSNWLWTLHCLCNSLQGFFLFLVFSCSTKVVRQVKQKSLRMSISSKKRTTSSAAVECTLYKSVSTSPGIGKNNVVQNI